MSWEQNSTITSANAGTAALPDIAPVGDPNTGIYSDTADTLRFSTGGTLAMTISSAQAVTFVGAQTVSAGGLTITAGGLTVSDGASAITDNAAATTAALALKNATAASTSVLALSLASDDAANGVDADSVYINFILDDDAQTQTVYGALHCIATDTANASDDGAFTFNMIAAGAAALERIRFASNGDITMTTDARTTATSWALKTLNGTFGNAAAVTVVGSVQLPANSLIIGVNMEITTSYTTTAAFSVGTSGDPNAWGSALAITDGTFTGPDDYTITAPLYTGAAADLILADDGGDENVASGAASYTIYYIDLPDIGV